MKLFHVLHFRGLLPLLWLFLQPCFGQGTAFTYQGRLEDAGRSATGVYEIRFQVFDRELPANVGWRSSALQQALDVTNGVFTAILDFGDVFDGADRFLELAVRPAGSAAPFEVLAPRQRITPTPYAMRAASLTGALPEAQLPGGVVLVDDNRSLRGPIRATDPANVFAGDGSALQGVRATGLGKRSELLVQDALYQPLPTSFRQGFEQDAGLGVLAGDFNGDGLIDLIGSMSAVHIATLHTNAGGGRLVLSPADVTGVSFGPKQAVKGNFNGDGSLDIAFWSESESRIQIFTNSSRGDLRPMSSIAITNVSAFCSIDLNQDGLTDLAVASSTANGNQLRIYLNGGNGLVASTLYPLPSSASDLAVGDVNGDGTPDLGVACLAANEIRVFYNNGGGFPNFDAAPAVRPRALDYGALDWPSTGFTYVSEAGLVQEVFEGSMIRSIGRTADGRFQQTSTRLPVGMNVNDRWVKIDAQDFNGDGRRDVLVAVLDLAYALRVVLYGTEFNSSEYRRLLDWDAPPFTDVEVADFDQSGEPDLGTSVRGGVAVWTRALEGTGLVSRAPSRFDSRIAVLGELSAFGGINVERGLNVKGDANFSGATTVDNLSISRSLNVTGTGAFSDVNIDGDLRFGTRTRQMLNLFGTGYGIGVQPETLYFRAASGPGTGFAWFLGGSHSNALLNPGGNGFRLMNLNGSALAIHAGGGGLELGYPGPDSYGRIYFRRAGDESQGYDVRLHNDAPGRLSVNGNLALSDALTFGTQTRQMIHLWSAEYGIGVQSSATYFRSAGDFCWFNGGSHEEANGNPGTGGQTLMKLSREGRLGLGNSSPAYSIDVRAGVAVGRWSSTNAAFGSVLVLQNTTPADSSSYLGAINFESATSTSGQIGYLSNDQMTFRVGGSQRMVIDAAGNVGITGTYSQASDRNAKQEIQPVDTDEVLQKVVNLPIATWKYRQDPSTSHVGPMAQDFHAAFGLGPDDRHITTVDADGVALAAIQGLNRRLEEARRENAELRERLERLERRLTGGLDR